MCIFTSKTLRDFTKTEPNCQILSKLQFGQTLAKGEKSFVHFINTIVIKRLFVSWLVMILNTGEKSQGVFKGCKEFTRIVKILKWVA